ncbi:hypothetical protein TGME49_236280 [Toxoplasma gondii ME49]|uniref:Uncharacterized protein n=2 Tax=Toxoplasma gondii TaxID=5811 RepID=A0A086JHS3_TOXGO|nr:hypothetical protein TGME49_236280 [Toxoplasma gondii ME49]EPT26669.1 hypothetical protein TGME49_236280 [Toxoplasma gondii ME49]KFG31691.1 hypothetical protein TGDOM2_236280 [Toxoplasma gondii GAB2-2007-GAL-DOM2]|eukprot:XP_002369011.1 hypothetical protein TGME49_236280 [Toxoplasma gondii ME49]
MPPMISSEKKRGDCWPTEDTQFPRRHDASDSRFSPHSPPLTSCSLSSPRRPPSSSSHLLSSPSPSGLPSSPRYLLPSSSSSLSSSSSSLSSSSSSSSFSPSSSSTTLSAAPFVPPSLPDSFCFSPVPLPLSDKPVPEHLSEAIRPSAYMTNIWTSTRISRSFSAQDFFLISRSLPNAEYSGGALQPLVLRLKGPSCTAVLGVNGRLSVMGGLTFEQASWQAYRVAYKLRFRLNWRFRERGGDSQHLSQQEEKRRLLVGDHPSAASPSSSLCSPSAAREVEYVHNPQIRFLPEEMKIQQMVCRLNMGGDFRPELEQVEAHPALRGCVVGIKDWLTIRVPLPPSVAEGSERNAETEAPAPRVSREHAPEGKRDNAQSSRFVWRDTCAWSPDASDAEADIAGELFAGLEGGEDSSSPASARRRDGLSGKRRKRERNSSREEERHAPLKPKKGATCIVYRSGRVLVLGCTSTEEIDYAVSFVWPALVGL